MGLLVKAALSVPLIVLITVQKDRAGNLYCSCVENAWQHSRQRVKHTGKVHRNGNILSQEADRHTP